MSSILPKKPENRFPLEFGYMLSCPIITWPGYEDSVTLEQKTKYNLEAMLNFKEVFEKEEAPDYHVCIYLSHASLVQPIGRKFTNIYLNLGVKFFPQLLEDETFKKGVYELEEDELLELKKIKQWIFKKQIGHIKDKFGGLK